MHPCHLPFYLMSNQDFPISIACWSGFGIFKKDWGDPDEIGMVGQSVSIMLDHYFTFIHSTMMT